MNKFESFSQNPEVKNGIEQRILPAGFHLPDLSPVSEETDPENPYFRNTEVTFDLEHAGLKLECRCLFQREADSNDDSEREFPVMLTVLAEQNGKDDPVFKFKGPLVLGKLDTHTEKDSRFWYISYRRVNEENQGKGFGKIALGLYEEIVQKIQTNYPELRADYIRIDTGLSSMAGLALSNGYKSLVNTEEEIQALLDEKTTDIKNRQGYRDKVILIKEV